MPAKAGDGDAFCKATADVAYQNALRCCTQAEKDTLFEVQLGIGLLKAGSSLCGPTYEISIAKGRISRDEQNATACIAEYAQAYANDCANTMSLMPVRNSAACAQAFHGLVQAGGACAGDFECIDGLTCVGASVGTLPDASTDGVCKAPPAIGEECGAIYGDGGIGTGIEKSSPSYALHPRCADGYCLDRKCTPKVASGGTCTEDEWCPGAEDCRKKKCTATPLSGANGACTDSVECQYPLKCTSSDAGTCVEGLAVGSTCGVGQPCKGRCALDGGTATCVSYCGSN